MRKKDISKQNLYLGVKTLVEEPAPFVHLSQHKLFTLFSIGFQYLLFSSTKEPGQYIIRVEDRPLAEKLSYKAKDDSTRKFMQRLILSRKLKFGNSTFYLDYFHPSTWDLVKNLPQNQVKGALIVKNTVINPIGQNTEEWDGETPPSISHEKEGFEDSDEASKLNDEKNIQDLILNHRHLTSLQNVAPKIIIIAYNQNYPNVAEIKFPFIKKSNDDKIAEGVTITEKVNFEED